MATALKQDPTPTPTDEVPDEHVEKAAEVFRIMSAPMRLRIIRALCHGEKNVSELLADISTTQPNMSQHLNMLYRSRVLGRRREGVQIYYSIADANIAAICRAVCEQIGRNDPD